LLYKEELLDYQTAISSFLTIDNTYFNQLWENANMVSPAFWEGASASAILT
jgi:hypothetical protein